MLERVSCIVSYTGIRGGILIAGLGIAASGAVVRIVMNYHERAYIVFLAGMICILASAGIDFLKKGNRRIGKWLLTPNSLLIAIGLFIAAADLFLFRMHTYIKTTAIAALGTAVLVACAFAGLIIWQARHREASEQR